jgi:hypothetical protein
MQGSENLDSLSNDESWLHEPQFKKKLEKADKWMRHYLANYPDRVEERWFVLYMEFQCDVHALSPIESDKVVETLRTLAPMSWDSVLKNGSFECKELASIPGKYVLRLSDSYCAVVGRDGRRMLYLALHLDA